MPITLVPITSPDSRSYLTVDAADAIAATLPASLLVAYLAASSPNKTTALEQASADVDAAGPFQGRRYLSEQDGQVLEFPRVAYEYETGGVASSQYPVASSRVVDVIWDWDFDAEDAVVPLNVKRAVVYQANAILDGSEARRLSARHGGLASQSVGGVSESYRDPGAAGVGGLALLTRRAADLMRGYRLRTGRLL